MIEDEFEKKIKEIMHALSPEKRAEDFFNKNYSDQWKKVPKEKKDFYIKKFLDPLTLKELEDLFKKAEDFENKKSNTIVLFLGVFLGVSGNLVASVIDKYFSNLGIIYDALAILTFALSSWLVYSIFVRKTAKEIKNKESSIEFLNIINEIESYK